MHHFLENSVPVHISNFTFGHCCIGNNWVAMPQHFSFNFLKLFDPFLVQFISCIQDKPPPVWVEAQVERHSTSRVEMVVKTKNQFRELRNQFKEPMYTHFSVFQNPILGFAFPSISLQNLHFPIKMFYCPSKEDFNCFTALHILIWEGQYLHCLILLFCCAAKTLVFKFTCLYHPMPQILVFRHQLDLLHMLLRLTH